MNKYDEITWARKLLELPEQASMEQIKKKYRTLIKKWHPDRCSARDENHYKEMTISINSAYKIISDYSYQCEISFSKEEITKYLSKEEWWLDRFGDDPLWGKSRP